MSAVIKELEQAQMRQDLAEVDFAPGDTVAVSVKVREGERERLQVFEGVVIARRNRGLNSSFTVRKISHGEGVERVFQPAQPLNRRDRRQTARQGTTRQVVLLARPDRQSRPHQRKTSRLSPGVCS